MPLTSLAQANPWYLKHFSHQVAHPNSGKLHRGCGEKDVRGSPELVLFKKQARKDPDAKERTDAAFFSSLLFPLFLFTTHSDKLRLPGLTSVCLSVRQDQSVCLNVHYLVCFALLP